MANLVSKRYERLFLGLEIKYELINLEFAPPEAPDCFTISGQLTSYSRANWDDNNRSCAEGLELRLPKEAPAAFRLFCQVPFVKGESYKQTRQLRINHLALEIEERKAAKFPIERSPQFPQRSLKSFC